MSEAQDSGNQKFTQEVEQAEAQNIFVLAAYLVLMRMAWIFKTETVIMPAFLDMLSPTGAGWIRGWLPILNRFGQSVPPVVMASTLANLPRKTFWLNWTTLSMAVCFAALAVLWPIMAADKHYGPLLFLVLYGLFFVATGLNQLGFNALQGKLIRADRRGRLMAMGGITGSFLAVILAYSLLEPWLKLPDGAGFSAIFIMTTGGFFLSALTLWLVREPDSKTKAKDPNQPHNTESGAFRDLISLLYEHQEFRKFAFVAMLFVTAILVFPHYQWLGQKRLGAGGADMMYWVVLQNVGVGIFSVISGKVADIYGNRLVLRWQILCMAGVPFLAVWSSTLPPNIGRPIYIVIYLLLGIAPVTLKSLQNYVLELSPEDQHERFLSSLSGCMGIPFIFSPLAGILFDYSPEILMTLISLLMFVGGLMTWTIAEPRHKAVTIGSIAPF